MAEVRRYRLWDGDLSEHDKGRYRVVVSEADYDIALGRISELETALRKVDEIRHKLRDCCSDLALRRQLVGSLKAPCMVVEK